MKVAYLGDKYSHCFRAASNMCNGDTLVGYSTIKQVLLAVDTDSADCAVVPLENNSEGIVTETIDSMIFDASLYASDAVILPIHHYLLGKDTSPAKQIFAHPQALAQCKQYLDKHQARAVRVAVSSASEAIGNISQGSYAIAPGCTDYHTVASNIEDNPNNKTTFIKLTKRVNNSGDTVLLSFEVQHSIGSLSKVLLDISAAGYNMTQIQSRPHRLTSRYSFLVSLDFAQGKEQLMKLLSQLNSCTDNLKLLGYYTINTNLGDN